jgi:hypothetical protein
VEEFETDEETDEEGNEDSDSSEAGSDSPTPTPTKRRKKKKKKKARRKKRNLVTGKRSMAISERVTVRYRQKVTRSSFSAYFGTNRRVANADADGFMNCVFPTLFNKFESSARTFLECDLGDAAIRKLNADKVDPAVVCLSDFCSLALDCQNRLSFFVWLGIHVASPTVFKSEPIYVHITACFFIQE